MPNGMSTRPARVGSAFAWEVAKHTTERDREIAWLLYRQKILTTDQLRLLFFGSLRRCQDRLLWLYRHRVIDRFYPAGPFSLGKPQAHWLLDEVGAHLVAARLGRDRRGLGWDRQQDFHQHAQLAHRLECNRFVCSIIAATLDTPDVWVAAWEPGWGAIKPYWSLPPHESARPDASLTLSTPFGVVGIAVEWDRATEPMATLVRKIRSYGVTLERSERPLNVCLVVPGERRAQRLYQEGTQDARRLLTARLWVTTAAQLETLGPLGKMWRCLDQGDRPYGMTDFETMTGVEATPQEHALGRRWQAPMPERWAALSPLRAPGRAQDTAAAVAADDDELAREWEQRRAHERTEAEHENQHGTVRPTWVGDGLRSGAGSDLLDHPQDHEQEEPWR
ncbi:MAG TPA: replication-relaxation family protein [Solirubrobacteraceae bacterium]|nr:replication-relaxation family protein [Solirubrobacteraceae bacterium]